MLGALHELRAIARGFEAVQARERLAAHVPRRSRAGIAALGSCGPAAPELSGTRAVRASRRGPHAGWPQIGSGA